MHKLNFAFVLLMWIATASNCQAGFIIEVRQVNNDVVATGSGTLNTTALSKDSTPGGVKGMTWATKALMGLGGTTEPEDGDIYVGATGPSSFGSGNPIFASSGSGGIAIYTPGDGTTWIFLPLNYVSGASLSGDATWLGMNFNTLGLTEGTYTWNWGSGANADFFTVDIGSSSSVLEPATLPLMFVAALAYWAVNRARRQSLS